MDDSREDEYEIERLRKLIALAAACSDGNAGPLAALGAAIVTLSPYVWSDEEHRVVFASVRAVGGASRGRLRVELAAQATRFGHPEVDWDVYFA